LKNTKICVGLVIQKKRRGMLTFGVMFLHDNARPHSSTVEHFNWELFDHPPYSPALAPSDYLPVYLHEELVVITALQQ
jgi:hypothetical protein